jgi:hypothetical protein
MNVAGGQLPPFLQTMHIYTRELLEKHLLPELNWSLD